MAANPKATVMSFALLSLGERKGLGFSGSHGLQKPTCVGGTTRDAKDGRHTAKSNPSVLSGLSLYTAQVGAGDSPLTVPVYEKCRFVRTARRIKNFFADNCDKPFVECGVRLTGIIFLQRKL